MIVINMLITYNQVHIIVPFNFILIPMGLYKKISMKSQPQSIRYICSLNTLG